MIRQIWTIAYYTLLEAFRNRLSYLLLLILLIGVMLSGFLEALAITESRVLQLTLLAAYLRLSAALFFATYVVTSLIREANDKGLELLLSTTLSRANYLLGKLLGYFLLALLSGFLFGSLCLFFSDFLQALFWTISLICELWILISFSLLCATSLYQVMFALSVSLGFYGLARSMDSLLLLANEQFSVSSFSQNLIREFIQGLARIVPHLEQFTRTEWLVYQTGSSETLVAIIGQTFLMLVLLNSAACFDFYRRNI